MAGLRGQRTGLSIAQELSFFVGVLSAGCRLAQAHGGRFVGNGPPKMYRCHRDHEARTEEVVASDPMLHHLPETTDRTSVIEFTQ